MTTSPVLSITAELLADLQHKAKAATPGPWKSEPSTDEEYCAEVRRGSFYVATTHDGVMSNRSAQENADFIAATSPEVVDALVEHIRSLTERLEAEHLAGNAVIDQLRAEVEALRKDAERYTWWRDRALRFRNDARRVLGNQPPMTIEEYDAETDAAMAAKEGV